MVLEITNQHLDWGAISSWLTVVVYVFNAILLYKALHSQIQVQKNQQRLTDMQRYLVREQIKPRFSAELSSYQKNENDNHIQIIANTKFRLNDHEAHNVSFPHDLKFFGLNPERGGLTIKETGSHLRNTVINCDFSIEGIFIPAECKNGKIAMEFCLHSLDDFQNEYEQRFIFSFNFVNQTTLNEEYIIQEVQSFEPIVKVIKGIIFDSSSEVT